MKNSMILSTFYLCFTNEQIYPEILNYDWNSVNFFKEIIIYQKFLLKKTIFISGSIFISKILKELEILKILNILKFYHRNRLWKIENFVTKGLDLKSLIYKLSRSEEFFAVSFKNLLFTFQNRSYSDFFLRNFESIIRGFKKNESICYLIQKEIYLFFRLLEKKNKNCFISNEEESPDKLKTNLIFCMKYCSIKFLICSKTVCLL
jgi:hypothetical protein